MTNETAATSWVMYADEGSYTIDVRHVEEMVGTTASQARWEVVFSGCGWLKMLLQAALAA